MKKSTKIFTLMKYQERVLNLFPCQQFLSIQFLEQVKVIILKCRKKNVNVLLKKKQIPKYIIGNTKISPDSDRENSD